MRWVVDSDLDRYADRVLPLHTDLANPTSNRIYRAIGHRPVGTPRSGGWPAPKPGGGVGGGPAERADARPADARPADATAGAGGG